MEQTDLTKQLYTIVLKVAIIFAVLSIIVNLIGGFPFSINIKWVFLLCIAFLSLLYEKHKGTSDIIKFLFFMFLICVFMPIGFVNAGGSNSFTITYAFFALIVVAYLFEGFYLYILIAAIIIAFMGMCTYDYLFPEKIPIYDRSSRFIDKLIQVPIVMLISVLVVRHFANAYYQANKRLVQHAHYDELTGLLNRRNFNNILQKKFDSGDYNGYIIMMDIDNFKMINDKKGHLVGDDCLKHLGGILSQYFDDGKNLITRWGGDEFIVIYYGDALQLDSILEKLVKDFKEYIDNIEPLVDISFGITALEGCQTPNDVLAKSDHIMYEEKKIKR